MIVKKCKGCGAYLQEEYPEKAGFIPKLTWDSLYCKRCFRMKNYNELPKIVANNEDYLHVIDSVIKRNGLIVFVVDIFSFKSTFTKAMIDKLRKKDVILVANKYDLFPKSTSVGKIVNWLSHQCERIFFSVNAIHIVSSKKGYYIDELMNTIDLARKDRDVYFVGCANVGKSSLINALLKRNTSNNDDVIATSNIPGTTLDEITIPFFEDNKAFIDTPGLINEFDILNHLLPDSFDFIIPNSEIKPITYQITEGNSICLAGLSSISFSDCDSLSVICYTSKNLYIHRCKTERLEELFKNQLGKLFNPPSDKDISSIEYDYIDFILDGSKKKDICFSGFGFISIIGKCKAKVKYIKNTEVFVVDSIIG